MNANLIKYGILAAGSVNVFGVLLFSKLFTNEVLNQTDPIVMSNFGLLMIMVWGLAYISVANCFEKTPWLMALFAVEKLVYVVAWALWFSNNSLSAVYEQDLLAGVFYSIYGMNDLAFMLFFAFVFVKVRQQK